MRSVGGRVRFAAGFSAAVALVVSVLVAVASVPGAGAQTAGDVAQRDQLIANQENLLNTYRCLFGVDVGVVPGGCENPVTVSPGAAPDSPSQADLDVRDGLIQNQEALLNVYRCRFDVDTEIVTGGCVGGKPAAVVELPAEGWYPDPSEVYSWRWWNGERWTVWASTPADGRFQDPLSTSYDPPDPATRYVEPAEPEQLHLMSVEELRAVVPHFGPPPVHVPSRGDVQAELRACVDLGIGNIQVTPLQSREEFLALCSSMYRAAAYAIDYGFAEPSCVHEQFRAWMLQPDADRRIFWADNCYSQLDPNPGGNWFHRCIALAELVSPPVALLGNTQPYIMGRICVAPSAEEIERFGRCIELVHLYGSGIGMGALARQPENQWELLLDFQPIPRDIRFWC